jgi:vacuolar-type H+-ATPase subunit E/Vma4
MLELVSELDVSVQNQDWRTVEEMIMSLIATQLKPGDLTRIAPSDIGGAVLEVEQLRVTNENSFAVRLATVLTSIFCSHLHRLMMARSSVLEKQKKRLRRTH